MIFPIDRKPIHEPFQYGMDSLKDIQTLDEAKKVQSCRSINIIELQNGDTVVINTKEEDGTIKEKIMTFWDNVNHKVKTLIKSKDGTTPLVFGFVEKNETKDGKKKLDKIV